jgi:dUTP pyrophosphatase
MEISVKLVGDVEVPLPEYQTAGAAGMDLRAAIKAPVEIAPGAIGVIPTGLAIAVPEGYEVQIRPRSGWAIKLGVTVVNSPGTVDSDFRGQMMVGLINLGKNAATVQPQDRIAQMVVCPVIRVTLKRVDSLDATARGDGMMSSTGTR